MQTHDYLIPDYYPDFACKMGACRAACCEGWPISFSLEAHFAAGMETMEALMAQLDSRSDSVRRYGEAALAYFGTDDEAFDRYRAADAHFVRLLPDWQVFFEHMLVNHMFFERFPFQDRPDSLWEEFVAISAVYALLRFLCLGWMAARDDLSDLIDVCAAAFRLIDHTQFDRYASRTLHSLGCNDPQRVHDLVLL